MNYYIEFNDLKQSVQMDMIEKLKEEILEDLLFENNNDYEKIAKELSLEPDLKDKDIEYEMDKYCLLEAEEKAKNWQVYVEI